MRDSNITQRKLQMLFKKIVKRYPPMVSTHEATELWAEFGGAVYERFLKKDL